MKHDEWKIVVPGSVSGGIIFVILFLTVWSALVAFGGYSVWNSGQHRSDFGVTLVPMAAVGLFFWGLVLRAAFGKLRVRGNSRRAVIFRGIGIFGVYRTFDPSSVTSVVSDRGTGASDAVVLSGACEIRFGAGLQVDSRDFVANALREALRHFEVSAHSGEQDRSSPDANRHDSALAGKTDEIETPRKTSQSGPKVMSAANWFFGIWGAMTLMLNAAMLVADVRYGVVLEIAGVSLIGIVLITTAIPLFQTCVMFDRFGLNANRNRTVKQVNARWKQLLWRLPFATSALIGCLVLMVVTMLSQGSLGSFRLSTVDHGHRILLGAMGILFSAVSIYGNLFVVRKCPDLIQEWKVMDRGRG
jgi:hypothetical protein